MENQKILEPEKNSLFNLEERAGNAQEFADSVNEYKLLEKAIKTGIQKVETEKQFQGTQMEQEDSNDSEIISLDDDLKIQIKKDQ